MKGLKIVRFNKPQNCERLVLSRKEFSEFKAHCRECNMTTKEFREVMNIFGIQIAYGQLHQGKLVMTR